MPESIADKMARFSSMGGDKPKVEVKRVFEMPVKVEPPKGKGALMKMLDDIDRNYSKNGVVR